jgi:hypothetical protein
MPFECLGNDLSYLYRLCLSKITLVKKRYSEITMVVAIEEKLRVVSRVQVVVWLREVACWFAVAKARFAKEFSDSLCEW